MFDYSEYEGYPLAEWTLPWCVVAHIEISVRCSPVIKSLFKLHRCPKILHFCLVRSTLYRGNCLKVGQRDLNLWENQQIKGCQLGSGRDDREDRKDRYWDRKEGVRGVNCLSSGCTLQTDCCEGPCFGDLCINKVRQKCFVSSVSELELQNFNSRHVFLFSSAFLF